jgi:hypothetical protein
MSQVFSRQIPDPTVKQNVVDVVDVPDSAGFVVSSKAVYSFRTLEPACRV